MNEEGSNRKRSSDRRSNTYLNQNFGLAFADPTNLSNSDHPGAQLIATQFNGKNFLSWSYGVKMALGAKNKLGFIDGSVMKPTIGSEGYEFWKRADYMVRCWLLNSMVGSISESFIYVNSAKQLWDEVLERYGQSNGPLLYQLK